jgi:hypothetical protein
MSARRRTQLMKRIMPCLMSGGLPDRIDDKSGRETG